MNSSLLRHVWQVIEMTQTDILTQLNDAQLVQTLVAKLKDRNLLPLNEEVHARSYIQDRLLLIRELAQSRKELCCPINLKVALHPPVDIKTPDFIAS